MATNNAPFYVVLVLAVSLAFLFGYLVVITSNL